MTIQSMQRRALVLWETIQDKQNVELRFQLLASSYAFIALNLNEVGNYCQWTNGPALSREKILYHTLLVGAVNVFRSYKARSPSMLVIERATYIHGACFSMICFSSLVGYWDFLPTVHAVAILAAEVACAVYFLA